MIRTMKLLAGASCIAVSAFGATAAFAVGTNAGDTISNTATVSYSVGSTVQPTVSNTPTTFLVDRKVVFQVVETAPIATTLVAPGQSAAVTTFTVTNSSNSTMDFGLALTQLAGGTAIHGGTDTFDVTAPTLYADTNGNGTYEPLTDTTVITFLDEVLEDTSRTVFAVANIPAALANGAVAGVTLTGQARIGGAVGQGAIATATAGANTAAVDTVLADTAYDALNTASDGFGVARDDYTVGTASLTVTKAVRVIEDPINTIASGNAGNAKMIPGATVEYCIVIANAAGGQPAVGVSLTDPVAATLLPVTGSVRVNATVTGGVCNADGVVGSSSIAGQNVSSGALNNIAAGSSLGVVFRATIL